MPKKSAKNYWFKGKKYGWGWGMPITRQGWLSFGIFLAVWVAALAWLILPLEVVEELSSVRIATFVTIISLDVLGLVYVSFKYGEPPKWRWGNKRGRSKKS